MSNFEARYGRAKRGERDRKLVLVLAWLLGLALVVWIVAVVFFAPPKVTGESVGFSSQSPLRASVKVQITAPMGSRVSCGVSAVNGSQSSVGFRVLNFTASQPTTAFEVSLNTTEQASAGMVSDCHLR